MRVGTREIRPRHCHGIQAAAAIERICNTNALMMWNNNIKAWQVGMANSRNCVMSAEIVTTVTSEEIQVVPHIGEGVSPHSKGRGSVRLYL